MNRLEDRCRRLLRAYPQPYRTERGEEILATLLESVPASRRWPGVRDARSLITGGLRVRAARNRQLPLAANLRLAALLAAALLLSDAVATYLNFAIDPGSYYGQPTLSTALFAVCALGACLAIGSTWFWPRIATVSLALAVAVASALALGLPHTQGDLLLDVRLIGPPLALAALARGKDRPPRSWLWIPSAFLIAQLPALFPNTAGRWWPVALVLFPVVFFGILGIVLLWFVVDARPATAFGLYFEVIYVLYALRRYATAPRLSDATGAGLIIALLAAALAGATLLLGRRRAET